MVSEPRKQLMAWMEMDLYSKHIYMYTLSMEDKMVDGAFGHTRNYGWDGSFTLLTWPVLTVQGLSQNKRWSSRIKSRIFITYSWMHKLKSCTCHGKRESWVILQRTSSILLPHSAGLSILHPSCLHGCRLKKKISTNDQFKVGGGNLHESKKKCHTVY